MDQMERGMGGGTHKQHQYHHTAVFQLRCAYGIDAILTHSKPPQDTLIRCNPALNACHPDTTAQKPFIDEQFVQGNGRDCGIIMRLRLRLRNRCYLDAFKAPTGRISMQSYVECMLHRQSITEAPHRGKVRRRLRPRLRYQRLRP